MTDLQKIQIEKANLSDSKILTEIAFAAKRHWDYPDNYFEIWKEELTITERYVNENIVYHASLDNSILGFYSIVENKSNFFAGEIFVQKGFWLEHIFIRPDFHKFGIGRQLIKHAKMISKDMKIDNLLIFVDPFAAGFYDKIGAKFLYNSKSSIPDRLIPVYDLKVQ
ncbi:GNAT family N-acetyltransferase [Maribellus maritimus]|uniref:GNAT family N-acetyltransferase n=1 Tax=Maribellus maritimus TaxID=2870838 RepID=UPI001EECCD62|nr:GNAT family N-acetyltransferase [Maribellus maritimus]MCG6191465.1 GNAT family N-acetyltransferase [Maribellus maritimus]